MSGNNKKASAQTDNQHVDSRPSMPMLRHKWIIGVNLLAGLILWFGYCTNLSWAGTIPDIIFPPIVAILAIVTLLTWARSTDTRLKRAYKFVCMPSLIGGCLPVLIAVLMLVPPFTLGFIFMASEVANEKHVESFVSPDNIRVADVYFRGVGAYGSGNGRVFIKIRSRFMPIVERDLYSVDPSYADENTEDYLRWKDRGTLEIINEPGGARSRPTKRYLDTGTIRFEPPGIIVMPINMLYMLFSGLD